jgi:hypothetical protein
VIAPQSEFYPTKETEVWILFDLRIAWEQARKARLGWARQLSSVHRVEDDHILLIIRPGSARRLMT